MRSDLHSVSTLEVWTAGTLFFSVGTVTGGLTFGVFSTGGNAADWVAAVGAAVAAAGTWAIGVGANRYAAQAQALEARQNEVINRDAARHRAAQIRLMTVWTRLAGQPFDSLVELVNDLGGDDPPDRAAATGAVAGNRDLLVNIRWDDAAWMLLSEEGIEAKIRLEVAVRAFNFLCNSYIDDYDIEAPNASDLLDPNEGAFRLLYNATSQIAEMAAQLGQEVEKVNSMQKADTSEVR